MVNDLVGQTVRERRGFMFGAALWTLLGMALVAAAAVTSNPHFALAAIAPIAIAALSVVVRRRPFVCRVEKDMLVLDEPRLTLPYGAIEEIVSSTDRSKDAFAICHANGFVSVPHVLTVPWQTFRRFLADKLEPKFLSPQPSAGLQENYERHVVQFGAGHMHVFAGRNPLPRSALSCQACFVVWTGLLIAAVVWGTAGFIAGGLYDPWILIGVGAGVAAAYGLLLCFLFEDRRRSRLDSWKNSCLVMGPGGLALQRGDTVSEWRWEDITKVSRLARPSFWAVDGVGGASVIRIEGAGVSITLPDVYQRPLFHVRELMERCRHKTNP